MLQLHGFLQPIKIINNNYQRIISLVPSQTELLIDLGLHEKIVGVTRYCIHPKTSTENITKIGGTKKVNMKMIQALKPDLIIANKEENEQQMLFELATDYPVWLSNILTINDAFNMILALGDLLNIKNKAENLVNTIQAHWRDLPTFSDQNVAYLIWHKPWMCVGSNTFINDVLQKLGFNNVFADLTRYPLIDLTDLKARMPRYIFLSTEPYPFSENHQRALQAKLPNTKIILVNGEYFSWYGSRMLYAVDYFKLLCEGLLNGRNNFA